MATTSIWRVNGWLGKVLIYIENPDKTENPDFFEKQDMKKAKEILGDTACIAGNLDTGLLMHGTPEAVTEETKRLLDICAPGGGYIMSNSISLDNCKRENLIAWRQTVSDCGKY